MSRILNALYLFIESKVPQMNPDIRISFVFRKKYSRINQQKAMVPSGSWLYSWGESRMKINVCII